MESCVGCVTLYTYIYFFRVECVHLLIKSCNAILNAQKSLFAENEMIEEDTRLLVLWAATWQNQQCGCAPSEDSDQHDHPSSLIRVFDTRMKKAWVLSYPLSAQRRLWSDWADAQADLSFHWARTHFVGFVMFAALVFPDCIVLL